VPISTRSAIHSVVIVVSARKLPRSTLGPRLEIARRPLSSLQFLRDDPFRLRRFRLRPFLAVMLPPGRSPIGFSNAQTPTTPERAELTASLRRGILSLLGNAEP